MFKQLTHQPVLITLDCHRLDPSYIENDFKAMYNFMHDKNKVLEGIQFLVGFDRYVQYVWNSYDTPGAIDGYYQLTTLLHKQGYVTEEQWCYNVLTSHLNSIIEVEIELAMEQQCGIEYQNMYDYIVLMSIYPSIYIMGLADVYPKPRIDISSLYSSNGFHIGYE